MRVGGSLHLWREGYINSVRRKRKLTKQGRLRLAINSLLDTVERENEGLRYIADFLFQHFVRDEASFESFSENIGGSRAKRMLRAFRVLYPNRRSGKAFPFWAAKVMERLESIRFTQKIERQQRIVAAQGKKSGIGSL